MNERRDLAVIQGENRFFLDPKQEKQLVDLTAKFLVKSKITVNMETIRAGAGVVMDSMSRGMVAEGRGLLKKGENIKHLVDLGLAQRERIRKDAVGILARDKDLPVTGQFGQYAIDINLYAGAGEQVNKFVLEADISKAEKLVKVDRQRAQITEEFWQRGLELLPKNLIETVRSRDWKDSEKASFVRNIIASAKYGHGTITPIISLDDVGQFLKSGKNVNESGESDNLLGDFFEVEDDSKKEFLGSLLSQVDELIEANSTITEKTLAFRKLNGVLMLLHPYLEETPIVTTQRKEETQISIWDNGNYVIVGEYKVPSKDILGLALRQASASHNHAQANQLERGVRAWTRMSAEKKSKESSIKTNTQRVEDAVNKYDAIDKEDVNLSTLPDLSYLVNEKKSIQNRMTALRHGLRTGQNAIGSANFRLEEAKALAELATSMQTMDGQITLPREVYLKSLQYRENGLRGSVRTAQFSVQKLEGLVEDAMSIFGGRRNFMSEVSNFRVKFSGGASHFISEIDRILEFFQEIKKSKNVHMFLMADASSKWSLINAAAFEANKLINDRHYRNVVVGARSYTIRELEAIRTKARNGILDSVSLNMLSRVFAGRTRVSYKEMRKNLSSIPTNEVDALNLNFKRRYYSVKSRPLPEDAKRSFEWVMDELNNAMVASLPEDLDSYPEKDKKLFLKFHFDAIRRYLPEVVDKNEFKTAAKQAVEVLVPIVKKLSNQIMGYSDEQRREKLLKINTEERRLENRRVQVRNLMLLLRFADTSLLDLDKAKGMTLSQYGKNLSRRIELIQHANHRSEYELQIDELIVDLTDVDKKIQVRTALDKVENARNALKKIEQKDEKDLFIQTMRPLGLVQPISAK